MALGVCVWLDPRGTRSPAYSLFLLLTWALRMLVVQSHISSSSVQDRQLWVNRVIQETEGVLVASMEETVEEEDRAELGKDLCIKCLP